MRAYRCKGTITVFLSLISILFLSLLCTAIESARIQGARAKAAAALDMGLFSVFGEFENEVLEQYDVFFLDGACGNGNYSTEELREKLTDYMSYNVEPNKGHLLGGYDPFKLSLDQTRIEGVQLATDQNGAAFYQQAVGFMKENLATEALNIWMERKEQGNQLQEAGELYEQSDKNIMEELETLQREQAAAEQQRKEEQKKQEEQLRESGIEVKPQEEATPSLSPSLNPLEVIKKIKKRGTMSLVLGNKEISQKTLTTDIASRRFRRKGDLPVKKEHSGLTADLLFQQYLFERYSLFTDVEKEEPLDYALEYILCGKLSDEANLKSVVKKLLFFREGSNFVYLSSNPQKKLQADALAALIVGAIPIPGLQAVTAYALILVWAYAESLMDLRILFSGGKVPITKTDLSWKLDLDSIPQIVEILDGTDGSKGGTSAKDGLDYAGYLQALFVMGKTSSYPMRALDLMEGYIRKNTSNHGFRADQAIVKMKVSAKYTIPPLFLRVSSAFLKTGTTSVQYEATGTFAY